MNNGSGEIKIKRIKIKEHTLQQNEKNCKACKSLDSHTGRGRERGKERKKKRGPLGARWNRDWFEEEKGVVLNSRCLFYQDLPFRYFQILIILFLLLFIKP